jgi:hypothetical protein
MLRLPDIIKKITEIFNKGLVTENGIIKADKLDISIYTENDVLVVDFLNSLPTVSITKDFLFAKPTISVKLTRMDFIDNNQIKLYFDGLPFHKTISYE